MTTRIEDEKLTIEKMITLYCRHKEGNATLCQECSELIAYAKARLDSCRYGEEKTSCRKCQTHCYNTVRREQIRRVMRFVGPRMFFYLPRQTIKHLVSK
ncbi:MAG: nitrous oxide-stimulated promoter family protein [Mucinivorans sp.]